MMIDAIIIGGGPAGATIALALAEAGWRVAIIEKAAFPRRKVCGEYLSPAGLSVLNRLGVAEDWQRRAGPGVRRVALFAGEAVVAALMPAAEPLDGFGRALGRDVLDALLLDAAGAAGAEIIQPARAVAVSGDGSGHRVTVECAAGPLNLYAPVVIAAHGSWEPGPLPTHLAKAHHPADLLGFKAHFRDAALPADLMPLLSFPGGYGGMVWADDGRLSLSCCVRRDVLVQLRRKLRTASAADAVHRHLLDSCRGVRDALDGARLAGPWLAAGPIRPGIRPRYAADLFRVGNCAGESHPIVAEGIAMAIQSGWLLAVELSRIDPADPAGRQSAGRRYAAAWRRQFATRIHTASACARLALHPLGAAAARRIIAAVPALLTMGARLSGKTRAVPWIASRARPPRLTAS